MDVCLKWIQVFEVTLKKKRIPVMITSVSAHVTSVSFYVSDASKRKILF